MRFSTHYYVISLSRQTAAFFEAFRDNLIDVQNGGFPAHAFTAPVPTADPAESAGGDERLRAFLQDVDKRFDHYFKEEPLIVVVTGEEDVQAVFTSVTAHTAALVGRVNGDFSATSVHDLGKIVWPVVKEAMSGSRESALRELEFAEGAHKICGLETVSRRMSETVGATLLVEEDYHVRGSISEADGSAAILPNVDVRNEMDDVVDMLIEKILGSGGNVIFAPRGSLSKLGRIVLLLREAEGAW